MRVAFGADDANAVTDAILEELRRRGAEVVVVGAPAGSKDPWAFVAERVARAVASGEAETGILCCYTGTGVSIAANKVPGVRAALCFDPELVAGARRWNDANVLCLSLMRTRPEDVPELLRAWFETTEVDPEELVSIEHLRELEQRR